MSLELKASTQYGDLQGTAKIDGYDYGFLDQIECEIPAEYRRVGFRIYTETPSEYGQTKVRITIYAVKVKEVGFSGDELSDYANRHDHIPVSEFRTEMKFEDLLKLIKRFDIVMASRYLEGTPMVKKD